MTCLYVTLYVRFLTSRILFYYYLHRFLLFPLRCTIKQTNSLSNLYYLIQIFCPLSPILIIAIMNSTSETKQGNFLDNFLDDIHTRVSFSSFWTKNLHVSFKPLFRATFCYRFYLLIMLINYKLHSHLNCMFPSCTAKQLFPALTALCSSSTTL